MAQYFLRGSYNTIPINLMISKSDGVITSNQCFALSFLSDIIKLYVHYCHTLSCCVSHNIIFAMLEAVSDAKRCQNIVKAGNIEIVGQRHVNVLNIFFLYIVTQWAFPGTKSWYATNYHVVVFWVPGGKVFQFATK